MNPIWLAALAVLALGVWLRSAALVWLVMAGLPATVLCMSLAAQRQRRRRLSAMLEAGLTGWGRPTKVSFGAQDRAEWSGAPGRLELHWSPASRRSKGETELHLGLAQSSPFKGFVAVSTHDVRRFAGAFGGPPVKLEDPAFDSAFYVRASPEELAGRLLGAEQRKRLLELKAVLPAGFELTIGSRDLGLYVAAELLDGGRLAQVLERLGRLAGSASSV